MRHIKMLIGLCFIVLFTVFSTLSFAACQRAIYNNSANPWEFSFSQNTGIYIHVNGQNYMCEEKYHFTCKVSVPAHQQATIFYYSSQLGGVLDGFTFTKVDIKDKNGIVKSYDARGYHYNCPHIEHKGRTGSVSMNEPHDGDFTVDKEIW